MLKFCIVYSTKAGNLSKNKLRKRIEKKEQKELKDYLGKFKDKPPLNFSVSRFS